MARFGQALGERCEVRTNSPAGAGRVLVNRNKTNFHVRRLTSLYTGETIPCSTDSRVCHLSGNA